MDSRATALKEANAQLARLSQRLQEGSGDLYRDLALYLQVLREGLPMAVHQATFHVATQLLPDRYGALAEGPRQELQKRLGDLVQRCGCLLTLEQLVVLAQQVRREQRRQHRREQQRLMATLLEDADGESATEGGAQPPLPPGSVRLALELPLSADLFASGLPGLAGLSDLAALVGPIDGAGGTLPPDDDGDGDDDDMEDEDSDDLHGELDDEDSDEGDEPLAGDPLASDDDQGADNTEAELDVEFESDSDADALAAARAEAQRIAERKAAAEAGAGDGDEAKRLNAAPSAERLDRPRWRADGEADALAVEDVDPATSEAILALLTTNPEGSAPDPLAPASEKQPPEPSLVPRQPIELLKWWELLDRALERRLRNLSHAINLDLLRLGLTRSLLPINLLDAVLAGQIEAMPAPANLLRLSMPFAPEGMAGQLEAIGLLLRSGDLEFDQAPLRTCRRRLERRRQDVSKMAQQYRHWQRRARALEAEQQWLEDSRTNRPTPP